MDCMDCMATMQHLLNGHYHFCMTPCLQAAFASLALRSLHSDLPPVLAENLKVRASELSEV